MCAMDALTKRPFLLKMLSLGCSSQTHQMLPSCVNEKKAATAAVAAAPSTNFWNENIIFTAAAATSHFPSAAPKPLAPRSMDGR